MTMRTVAHLAPAVVLVALIGITSTPSRADAASCNGAALVRTAYGESSAGVQALQTCLIAAGYAIPAGATGYFGPQTRSAVQQFYRAKLGLTDWDGLSVGPQGRATLAQAALGVAGGGTGAGATTESYKRAGTDAELQKYVAEQQSATFGAIGIGSGIMRQSALNDVGTGIAAPSAAPLAAGAATSESTASRVSDTNVQVPGIDEPDIVKTDGQNIFVAEQPRFYAMPLGVMQSSPSAGVSAGSVAPSSATAPTAIAAPSIMPPIGQDTSKTQVVRAYPPADLAVLGDGIKERGDLLLVRDRHLLVILAYPDIVAYDVATPATPVKKWTLSLADNTSVVTARLADGKLYFVTSTYLSQNTPCPAIPVLTGASAVAVRCADVWVPSRLEPVNQTYTVMAVDPATGAVGGTQSFAAESGNTTVAMFPDNLYIATKSYGAPYEVLSQILVDVLAPYISAASIARMRTILTYDISADGKLNEIEKVLAAEYQQMTADERMKVENEVMNAAQTAIDARIRDLDRTRLVRIDLATLGLAATGAIPGTLLNQFALDEYQGTLRAAVTVGGTWLAGFGQSTSKNDVYTLGFDLAQRGSITDLGTTERIYSARFVGDRGYLVTFRQTDPFYVLDLSSPAAPKLAGELKLPGYSAYLEPLTDSMVLGVGKENNQVKVAIYDVSNAAAPVERSKYTLAENWTDVENNHHAFLRDADHQVVFLPGSQGGYVLSYANNTLALKATVSGWSVNRAVYIGDYLYVVGDNTITVLDENKWKMVASVSI